MLTRRNAVLGSLGLAVTLGASRVARADVALRGDLVQGTLLRGRTELGAQVWIDGRKLTLTGKGDFVFGFAYDRVETAMLKVRFSDDSINEREIKLAKREYRVQRINGLPEKFVEPPASVMERIERDNRVIAAARSRDTDEAWFADEFAWPVRGPLTGFFGSQRILNGVPKRPHFGLDIAAGEGKQVTAPAGAVVSMVEPDLYFTGGTVMLDHGHGVSTTYLHLSRIDVKMGQRLGQGDPVGAVGQTGRATGPHLCWRANWFQERVDPALLVPPMKG